MLASNIPPIPSTSPETDRYLFSLLIDIIPSTIATIPNIIPMTIKANTHSITANAIDAIPNPKESLEINSLFIT